MGYLTRSGRSLLGDISDHLDIAVDSRPLGLMAIPGARSALHRFLPPYLPGSGPGQTLEKGGMNRLMHDGVSTIRPRVEVVRATTIAT